MHRIQSCFFIALLTINLRQCSSTQDSKNIEKENHDFDVIIFTQRWPVSGCLSWIEANKKHSCSFPSPKEIWTIHGVWPTKYGQIGPSFCNHSAKFDIDELAPFVIQLQHFWLNIQKGKGIASLWKHEWLKHGTCAAQLTELNSENKYFGQGLSWMQQYTMSTILQKGDILPDSNHSLLEIHAAIVSVLNKNPTIHCFHDPIQNHVYLEEIRICFNKSLELIDCEHVIDGDDAAIIKYTGGKIITNCPLYQMIEYPSVVPESRIQRSADSDWKFPFVNVYKLIQLVQWFTL